MYNFSAAKLATGNRQSAAIRYKFFRLRFLLDFCHGFVMLFNGDYQALWWDNGYHSFTLRKSDDIELIFCRFSFRSRTHTRHPILTPRTREIDRNRENNLPHISAVYSIKIGFEWSHAFHKYFDEMCWWQLQTIAEIHLLSIRWWKRITIVNTTILVLCTIFGTKIIIILLIIIMSAFGIKSNW